MRAADATDPQARIGRLTPGLRPRAAQGVRRAAAWICLLVLVLLPAGCRRLPSRPPAAAPPLEATAPAGRLQEVAPPPAVRQLQDALSPHHPRVKILAPAPDGQLGSGDWTARVSVADWPLTDAGPLGLGAHLVLQIDDEPPLRLTGQPSEAAEPGATIELSAELPELSPGSHRITAYAARPWGEAVKSPVAHDQIRVHRVAANPLALPAPGSPQLIPASPAGLSSTQPVLLDWLLLDAPLQGLREGDGSWRLRITVNGDSFLVDEQVPLWLKGWRSGSNSVVMELVDGRGEPLNPPFNTLVRDVTITAAGPTPAWQRSLLSEQDLSRLLGQAPGPEATSDATPNQDVESGEPLESSMEAGMEEAPIATGGSRQDDALFGKEPPQPDQPTEVEAPVQAAPQPQETQELQAEPLQNSDPAVAAESLAPEAESLTPEEAGGGDGVEDPGPHEASSPDEAASPDRVVPETQLEGSARDVVREDGSLIQPKARGPLARWRERLAP